MSWNELKLSAVAVPGGALEWPARYHHSQMRFSEFHCGAVALWSVTCPRLRSGRMTGPDRSGLFSVRLRPRFASMAPSSRKSCLCRYGWIVDEVMSGILFDQG